MTAPISLGWALLFVALAVRAQVPDGRSLIEASLQRHALPAHLYEEQSMILTDRLGQHTVRTTRFYAQFDGQRWRKLLVIESPAELKGSRHTLDLSATDKTAGREVGAPPVFGSDFSVADLAGEQTSDTRYEITGGTDLDRIPHHVVRATPATGRSLNSVTERHLYLRKDNLYISRVDYLDRDARVLKRLSRRDPRADDSGAWHANMMLMENLKERRRSLLKVERRVQSPDYIPDSIFAGLTDARP